MTELLPRPIRIVGGGLAGLSLGSLLRRHGVPVELYEPHPYPRHRVCGECLSGLSEEVIGILEIGDILTGVPQHRRATWFDVRGGILHDMALPHPSWGISRHRLDHLLVSRFQQSGGQLKSERWRGPVSDEGTVIACGRALHPRKRLKAKWVGLKMHVKNPGLVSDLEMHLGRGGYIGLSKVENDSVNVCGLFRSAALEGLKATSDQRLVAAARRVGLAVLADKLEDASLVPDSTCGTADFSPGVAQWAEDVFRVGDAARQIPPFTGHGMAMALESACRVAPYLEAYSMGKTSWVESRQQAMCQMEHLQSSRLQWACGAHPLILLTWLHPVVKPLLRFGPGIAPFLTRRFWGEPLAA
ncbi:MAG: NAD(P)/FAD-dependent oxidoreductase [Candidatus Methylacidiphilales bacterium]